VPVRAFKPLATKEYRVVVVCCVHSVGTAAGGELSASRCGSFFTSGERSHVRWVGGYVNPRAGLVALWYGEISCPSR
jgi:hypothetical protein